MTITLTREEAQQVLAVLDDLSPQHGRPDDVEEAIETLRARLAQSEPDYRDVVIKGDLWRIEFLPDHAASVVLVRANYEAQLKEKNL
jgi:FKBP-type peptidyl-prolyl cis-trans isomerase (trigger factor)